MVSRSKYFFDILARMFPPNTDYLPKIWEPLLDTLKMSILGSFVGAVLAVPFAVLAASNIVTNRVVVLIVRLFLSIVRTLPTLVTALIATYIFGLGTMNNYRSSGAGGYFVYQTCPVVKEINVEMSDLLMDYFEKFPEISCPSVPSYRVIW